MLGIVPSSISRGFRHLSLAVTVWLNMKHTYNNIRSQKYAGDPDLSIMYVWLNRKDTYNNARSHKYAGNPDLSIMYLVIFLMCLHFPSV